MENLILIAVGIAIIYQSYKLIKQQKELRKDMNKWKDDRNIEFSATEGSGIELIKKEYPDVVLRDDPRTGTEPTKEK